MINMRIAKAQQARGFRPRHLPLLLALTPCLGVILTAQTTQAQQTAPTLRLFPTTVIEDIKHTGNVAQEMETDLQNVIARLDQQAKLFAESKCDDTALDAGCAQISKQLGATYLEMLNTMGDRLPDMEKAVRNTQVSLEKRLRSELGEKMTSWDLQEMLLGEGSAKVAQAQSSLRGRSGMRLSDRFRQYYKLVAHPASKSTSSMAVIASDIYLDMQETSALIALTQQEIGRTALMEELNQSLGMITPEMQEVVAGVKTILFGDAPPAVSIAGPPPGRNEQAYRSPLQL